MGGCCLTWARFFGGFGFGKSFGEQLAQFAINRPEQRYHFEHPLVDCVKAALGLLGRFDAFPQTGDPVEREDRVLAPSAIVEDGKRLLAVASEFLPDVIAHCRSVPILHPVREWRHVAEFRSIGFQVISIFHFTICPLGYGRGGLRTPPRPTVV